MRLLRPALFGALFCLALFAGPGARAQSVSLDDLPTVQTLVKDQDFRILDQPVRTSVPSGEVEVIGFFHYGSPWVAKAVPYIRAWRQDADPRIHFKWAPAVLDDSWGWGARVYFALDELGKAKALNPKLMLLFADGQLKDHDLKGLVAWLKDQGVNTDAFLKALNSGKDIARTAWVPNVMAMYQVRTVPTFVINGKYVVEAGPNTTPEMAVARMLYIARHVLADETQVHTN